MRHRPTSNGVAIGVTLIVAIAGLALAANPATADRDRFEAQVVAHDDATNCVADEAPCYEIANDGWTLVEVNDTIDVTFENNASQPHALNIAPGSAEEDDANTSTEQAFLRIEPVQPGQTASASATLPAGTDTAYLFCHLDDHEAQGLHLLRNVHEENTVEKAEERGPGMGNPNESPSVTPLVLVPIAALAALRRIREGAFGDDSRRDRGHDR
jgi:hypothetical protein